jgi:receptor protein-tyrosine kinase
MRQTKALFEELPRLFQLGCIRHSSAPFFRRRQSAGDHGDGTILVVKIGSTTFDNVTRAMQSLCENNVLGIVANGARASELYSKYTTTTRSRSKWGSPSWLRAILPASHRASNSDS